jgi:hypothetical protein
MRKFTRLNEKINKKGFNFDSKKGMFRPMDVKNIATIVAKKGTSVQIVPKRIKETRTTRASIAMIQAMMKKRKERTKTRDLGRRRPMTRRPSSSQRRKGTPRKVSWWKNKSG